MSAIKKSCIALLTAATLAACSSEPVHFYTLVSEPAAGATPGTLLIDVAAVSIPAQVDMPQLVIREGSGQVAVAETQQWIAPVADEIRNALAADLAQRLQAVDVHRAARTADAPVYRITFDVQRFESALGRRAYIEGVWSVRAPAKDAPLLSCAARAEETVGAGYAALVEGHQRALKRISEGIAAVVEAGATAHCP